MLRTLATEQWISVLIGKRRVGSLVEYINLRHSFIVHIHTTPNGHASNLRI